MRKLAAWLGSWATTLHIMVFERGTYRVLRDLALDPDEFTEAARPGPEDGS
jgi:hypothetical protein